MFFYDQHDYFLMAIITFHRIISYQIACIITKRSISHLIVPSVCDYLDQSCKRQKPSCVIMVSRAISYIYIYIYLRGQIVAQIVNIFHRGREKNRHQQHAFLQQVTSVRVERIVTYLHVYKCPKSGTSVEMFRSDHNSIGDSI